MEEYISIEENVSYEIIEKKSKFISNIYKIESQEEAENIIKQTRKKFYDARHNCFAYRIIEKSQIIERSSDDGEPSGTAGAPMLAILQKNNLCNILVIVTRYFGGILLGTGGLVRAYSDATLKCIDKAKKVIKCEGTEMQVKLEYNNLEIFKYYCKNHNINITKIEYFENIVINIELENKIKQIILEDIKTKTLNILEIKELRQKYIDKVVEENKK